MGRRNAKTKSNKPEKLGMFSIKGIDLSIVFISIFLSIFCLVFVYSALAFEPGETKTFLKIFSLESSDRTLIKTIGYILAGLIGMFALAWVNFKETKTKAPLIYAIISNPVIYYAISCGMFIFIEIMKHVGTDAGGEGEKAAIVGAGFLLKANGAYRWIHIPKLGLSFQPSEVSKFLLIVCFAIMIFNAGMCLKHKRGIVLYLLLAGIPSFLILECSSDLSSSIVVFGILFIMMLVAGPDLKNTGTVFLVLVVLGIIAFGLLVLPNHGKEESDIHPYQAKRILAWLYPDEYPASADQTNQAMYAIGSGGVLGEGIGNSMQKIKKLPEAQNDMIFSVICEELGLFGGISIVLLFALLLWRLMIIAINATDLYGALLVVGVMAHISIQVVLNIAVVTNTVPNTGISLPFISYGGSSVMFLLIEIGLVNSVARKIRF